MGQAFNDRAEVIASATGANRAEVLAKLEAQAARADQAIAKVLIQSRLTGKMAEEQEQAAAMQDRQSPERGYVRELYGHHDGHGLNESIHVHAGPQGPGGSAHLYGFSIEHQNPVTPREESGHCTVGYLHFQEGPRNEVGSSPGLTTAAVLVALIDHLAGFQKGPYPSRETALVITKLEEALHWTRARADARAARGVLGTYEK